MSQLDLVQRAGVIGAGGAGFPTHVKLNTKADYVLLNGAECEPLLRVDQQLMATHPEEVLDGLLLAKEITGAAEAVIGVKVSHPEVIETLRETIARKGLPVTVGELTDVYPAGETPVPGVSGKTFLNVVLEHPGHPQTYYIPRRPDVVSHLMDIAEPGDLVIIVTYATMSPEEAKTWKPTVIRVNGKNEIIEKI